MEKNVREMSRTELLNEQSRLEALTSASDSDEVRWEQVCDELYDRADAQEKDAS